MTLPPLRDPDTGETTPRPPFDPCAVEIGDVSYPSFLPVASSGRRSRACASPTRGGCGTRASAATAGAAPSSTAPSSRHAGRWSTTSPSPTPTSTRCSAHLEATGVPILEGPYPFGETRAVLIEDLDGLALELIQAGSD